MLGPKPADGKQEDALPETPRADHLGEEVHTEHEPNPAMSREESYPADREPMPPDDRTDALPSDLPADIVSQFSGYDGGAIDLPDEEEISDFAESVVSGLAHAGMDLDAGDDLVAQHATDLPDASETYFGGWGDVDTTEEHEDSAGRDETQAFALIDAASTSLHRLEGAPETAKSKHDELADAVQSALLSVYGEHSLSALTAPQDAVGLTESPRAASVGWNAGRAAREAPADDNLSPQDVILNYFDYKAGSQTPPRPASPFGGVQTTQPSALRTQGSDTAERIVASSRGGTFSVRDPDAMPLSVGESLVPAFPVPLNRDSALRKTSDDGRQENSRLLGAAAIGLVGGIGIAAALAVFVINSYQGGSPEGSTSTATRRGSNSAGTEASGTSSTGRSSTDGSDISTANMTAIAGQPALLPVSVRSQHPMEQTLVSITGVPEGARLSAGVDAGNGTWLLSPRRLSGLTVNFPATAQGINTIEVELLDSNSRAVLADKKRIEASVALPGASSQAQEQVQSGLPANRPDVQASTSQVSPSFTTQTVPTPAGPTAVQKAPPQESSFKTETVSKGEPRRQAELQPQAPAADVPKPQFQAALVPDASQRALPSAPQEQVSLRPSPQPEVEDLIREGNKRMREGDILEARQLYLKAIGLGDPEAALAMGRSYDPIYFARIDKKNAEPDAAKAFEWYRKAMDSGAVQTAKVRIENLKHFLNE